MRYSDPPPKAYYDWAAVALELRRRRGEWAELGEMPPSSAEYARKRLRSHNCEITTRTVATGRMVGVWARFP